LDYFVFETVFKHAYLIQHESIPALHCYAPTLH